MRYAVFLRRGKKYSEVGIPDFKLTFEYPVDTTLAQLATFRRDRLMSSIQQFIDHREKVPSPDHTVAELRDRHSDDPGYSCRYVTLAWPIALKVEAYNAWRKSKMSELALSKATGLSRSGVRNLFKFDIHTEMRGIALVFEALDYRVDFTVTKIKRVEE